MLRRFSVNYALVSMGFDFALVWFSLRLTAYIRPILNALPFAKNIFKPIDLPLALQIAFPLVWVFMLAVVSVYDGRKNLRFTDEIRSVSGGALLASGLCAGVLYLTFRDISRVMFILFVVTTFIFTITWRALAWLIWFSRDKKGTFSRRILIVGAGPVGRQLESHIDSRPFLGQTLVGFLDDDLEKQKIHTDILGSLENARNIIAEKNVNDVVFALPSRAHERISQLAAEIHDLPVRVWLIPDYLHLALYKAVVEDFAGLPMLDLRAPALTDYERMIKRLFDLVITSIGLIIILPVMGLIAIAIYLDSRSPILFKQNRAGENGKQFRMYKFRTMMQNAEAIRSSVETLDEDGNIIHKRKDDPRVTRVGKFLRRFSLDELPQVFNILKGEMSLVGPRPELPFLVEKYEPWQRKRFAVPQGMTGWWQIHGRSDKPMHLHTEDDLYYVQNFSIWLDIQIILMTFWVVIRGKGAY